SEVSWVWRHSPESGLSTRHSGQAVPMGRNSSSEISRKMPVDVLAVEEAHEIRVAANQSQSEPVIAKTPPIGIGGAGHGLDWRQFTQGSRLLEGGDGLLEPCHRVGVPQFLDVLAESFERDGVHGFASRMANTSSIGTVSDRSASAIA